MARWKFSLPPEQIIKKAFVVRPAELPREDRHPSIEATMVRPDLLIRIAKEDNWRSSRVAGAIGHSSRRLRSGVESNSANKPDGERVTVPEDAVSIRPDLPTKSSPIKLPSGATE